jgi:hypothetical protein
MKEDWDESYYEEIRSQGYTQEDEERRRHMLESATGEASLSEHSPTRPAPPPTIPRSRRP